MVINYDTVDLGLPSGLKWAKCNLGAKKESDCGLYFQWGSTKGYTLEEIKNGKKKVVKIDAPYYDKESQGYTKYHPRFDKKVRLDKYDDAISKIMGLNYRMPTKEDFEELLANTTNEWITNYEGSGVKGRKFTSNVNGNTLFIPASGLVFGGSMNHVGSNLLVWSSSLDALSPNYAWGLFGCPTTCGMNYYSRWYGFSLRGVSK